MKIYMFSRFNNYLYGRYLVKSKKSLNKTIDTSWKNLLTTYYLRSVFTITPFTIAYTSYEIGKKSKYTYTSDIIIESLSQGIVVGIIGGFIWPTIPIIYYKKISALKISSKDI